MYSFELGLVTLVMVSAEHDLSPGSTQVQVCLLPGWVGG
jgi:hypothetical protein